MSNYLLGFEIGWTGAFLGMFEAGIGGFIFGYLAARLRYFGMAFAMAVICGLSIFIATAWLLIKGGLNVGQHLQLLGQYFPGYKVTWIGSLVGMFYGAIVGGVVCWLIRFIYNQIVDMNKYR